MKHSPRGRSVILRLSRLSVSLQSAGCCTLQAQARGRQLCCVGTDSHRTEISAVQLQASSLLDGACPLSEAVIELLDTALERAIRSNLTRSINFPQHQSQLVPLMIALTAQEVPSRLSGRLEAGLLLVQGGLRLHVTAHDGATAPCDRIVQIRQDGRLHG